LTLRWAPVYRSSMNTPNTINGFSRRSAVALAAVGLAGSLALLAPGCASGGAASGGSAPAAPSGPVELDGTRWKLVALGGNLDGRIVEFKKRGSDGYEGKIVDLGRKLRDVVGLNTGFVMFSLKKKGENEYEGVYNAVDNRGGQAGKEVMVFVNGNNLTWNQESAVWERQ
jgi:hypothetical protein